MNKKHELVEKVLKVLEDACVEQDACDCLRSEIPIWETHPAGHYNDCIVQSVEGELSCLTEGNLEAILALGVPEKGIAYSKLWREWGRHGCFRCIPEVLQFNNVPVLRIRHDSYLSWFRGYRFQNSYDAFGNGSNGESEADLQRMVEFCRDFRSPDYPECREHMSASELSACCSALILSYPFYACRGKKTFYQAINSYPEVFDEFMQKTELLMRTGGILTLSALREAMATTEMDCPVLKEFSFEHDGSTLALLRVGSRAVQLVWFAGGQRRTYTLKFPVWEYDRPSNRRHDQYTDDMWSHLTYTMLTLAGFSATEFGIRPNNSEAIVTAPSVFYSEDERVRNLNVLWSSFDKLLG